jgi:hypothetical protein
LTPDTAIDYDARSNQDSVRRSEMRLWLLALLAASVAFGGISIVRAQSDVQIIMLLCTGDPEMVVIKNNGGAAQDMAGWTLRNGLEAPHEFDLSAVVTLAAGQTILVESGPSASASPPISYFWTSDFVFRDNDTSDYARILINAQGQEVSQRYCTLPGTPTATPTPTPTPSTTPSPTDTAGTATATPTPTATATPTGTVTATPAGTGTATATVTTTTTPAVTETPTPTPVATATPSPTPTKTPTPAATPQLAPSPKTTAVPASATPKAPPPTGARGGGGFGGLGLALALLLAAGLLAGTASLIAFSFRRRA